MHPVTAPSAVRSAYLLLGVATLLCACDEAGDVVKSDEGTLDAQTQDSGDSGEPGETGDSGDSGTGVETGDSDETTIVDTQPPVDTDPGACTPMTCAELGAECGTVDDGCGTAIECGGCSAWYGCGTDGIPNVCAPADCVPYEEESKDGGGKCENLDQAWTARGINVGYYPFEVMSPVAQYSGDYDGPDDTTFTPGTGYGGVILQIIPAGSFVGLSSVGPYYDPPDDCYPGDGCGDDSVGACGGASTPPLRPGTSGFYWGYAYSGASHMQGWIYMDSAALRYAGDDASHPCAVGPAGLDFEVEEACGAPTVCDGENRTCDEANPCDEGDDDCGSCGAESSGSLTPSAHRMTVTIPDDAKACTVSSPPDPSVLCLDYGDDVDHFYVYPHGAYLYWAQDSTTKAWIHYGDEVQVYFHIRDGSGMLWDFIEVLSSNAPVLTPASDGAGAPSDCDADHPENCDPCKNGGTCGWVQDVFLQ